MTRYQAEQMAISLRAAGWPIVSVERTTMAYGGPYPRIRMHAKDG